MAVPTHPGIVRALLAARSETSRFHVVGYREPGRPSTLDEVIGLQFSCSYSSPAQLGGPKDAFERDLRQALTGFSPAGAFDELVRTEAIIATRP